MNLPISKENIEISQCDLIELDSSTFRSHNLFLILLYDLQLFSTPNLLYRVLIPLAISVFCRPPPPAQTFSTKSMVSIYIIILDRKLC